MLRPEATVTPADLRTFCGETLASYKVPRHLFVIADGEVPRTATGKIEKAALKQLAAARLTADGC